MEAPKTKVVLFLGAGFSVPSGYPCTAQLNKTLLETPAGSRDVRVEQFITATIRKFWETVFAWRSGMREPSFEDHFTQIDMAVNSGHNFGPDYDSAKLRAIHKMTIHRIFGWLRKPKGLPDYDAAGLVVRLSRTFEVTIITTNWDTHVEWILNAEGPGLPFRDISLLKLHGCVNMSYCDCCQQWTRLEYASKQAAVDMELLLDPSDFRLLGELGHSRRMDSQCRGSRPPLQGHIPVEVARLRKHELLRLLSAVDALGICVEAGGSRHGTAVGCLRFPAPRCRCGACRPPEKPGEGGAERVRRMRRTTGRARADVYVPQGSSEVSSGLARSQNGTAPGR